MSAWAQASPVGLAVENTENGRQITDDLIWRLTNTETGEVVVADPDGREIAVATVTYKLNPGRGRPPANEVRPGG